MDWDKRNKISEFFGAEPVKYSFLDEMSWEKRNELANKLTQGTAYTGLVGGLSAVTAAAITDSAALGTAGLISTGVGAVMLVPTLISYMKSDKTIAPLSMKALTSLGIGAKNLVCMPFKAIKKKIEEHHNDYNNSFHGPYAD